MEENEFSPANLRKYLKEVPNLVVVKYKTPINTKKALDIISTKPSADLEHSSVQTLPTLNLSIIARRIDEDESIRRSFSESLAEDTDVEFTSPAYKYKDTESLLVITNRINVGFKEGVNKQTIEGILREFNLSIDRQDRFSPRHYTLKVNNADNIDKTLDISEKLLSKTEVQIADPIEAQEFRKLQIPKGKYFSEQWHLNNTGQGGGSPNEDVKALDAWEITKGNPKIVIACLDDGLSHTHKNINVWNNPDPQAPDKHGYDYFDDDPDPAPKYFQEPFDDHNVNDIHGTPCAGVICAAGETQSGVHGIAPECKVLGVKIFGKGGFTQIPLAAEAIRYSGQNADILSCSWGGDFPNPTIASAIREVVKSGRNGKGCPIFCATGNDSEISLQPVDWPANMTETIAVGASTDEGKRSRYSNVGKEVDLVAPSNGGIKGIFTTDVPDENRGFNLGRPGQGDPQGLYTNEFGGTSSATPLAAGIGALVLSVNPNLTAEQVRQVLRRCCDKIDPANARYDANGFSKTHGYGRVNARRAVELAKEMV